MTSQYWVQSAGWREQGRVGGEGSRFHWLISAAAAAATDSFFAIVIEIATLAATPILVVHSIAI
jgi:hypothetical protein